MDNYFVMNILGLPKEQEDLATGFWFEYGAEGVSETLSFRQEQDNYEPVIVEKDYIDIQVYFLTPPTLEVLESFRLKFTAENITVTSEENKDWMEEWKKGFEAFSLTGDLWVVPSWLSAPPQAQSVISMDPGMAFGTGTHNTTQLAADGIRQVLNDCRVESALDVGTGTGILAILARMSGVPKVRVNDIDELSCEVAQENFDKNKITDIEFVDKDLSLVKESYDLVIANIIDGVLTELKPQLLRCTKPGGHLVVSGILEEREEIFMQSWSSEVEVVERFCNGEWLGFIFKKV